jgi:hypothetical protein
VLPCLAGILLVFGLLEAWVRVFRPPPYPARMYERHDTRGFSLRKNFSGTSSEGLPVRINSLGLRDREYAAVPPRDVDRILVLGDSVVFGYGVRAEETFPKRLEQRLRRDRPGRFTDYEIISAGFPAYNAVMEFMYLRDEGLHLKPGMVMLCYILNDAEPGAGGRADSWTGRRAAGLREFCRLHCRSLLFLKARFRRLGTRMGYRQTVTDYYSGDRRGWDKALSAVEDMQSLCAAGGVAFMVILFPRLEGLQGDAVFAPLYRTLSEEMGEKGIDVIDLFPAFSGRDEKALWVSERDRHPNARAHGIAARAVYPHLLRRYP